jgi:protein JSN1
VSSSYPTNSLNLMQVVQKLFERCSPEPRFAMLERISPHLAMIGIHKNGTWAAQKIIECVQSPEEVALVAQNLRAYAPPLLLDQFGNYVVQCVSFGVWETETDLI